MDVAIVKSLPDLTRAPVGDTPADILSFAVGAWHQGKRVALATLVDIRGGAARALGAHVAISGDGRFCGYVSGGCVEAAVAAEALQAMEEGRDRIAHFGDGSPFFDIVLPCGGGISVAIHVVRDVAPLEAVLGRLEAREAAGLRYCHERQSLAIAEVPSRPGPQGADFLTVYRPLTRVVISGRGAEAEAVARMAAASGWVVERTDDARFTKSVPLDGFTACVLLHHDLDAEQGMLDIALRSPSFYIGALGSTRTHRRREEMLWAAGHSKADIARIKAPIGMFGPTRDAQSLAISVVADIAACRLATSG
ncbi:XdhC family protein [Rhizobium sp. 2MFCol3.1]|uniref:XdhC family protein n=1 Tax=Rhizobium sp. 2MFCol3.1 TaxID=1246459 RepID=UPI00037648F7|nr:XdhC family protein [Rhizobium sp. 2MFCol3.1]